MTLDLDTALLRVLRAVVETRSFTAASLALGFTQSAVSKQIATLEARAGTPLFTRGARGVEPTPAGVLLLTRAGRVLDELDLLERDLADLRSPLAGRVALGGFATAAMRLVPRTLARIGRQHGGVVVDFEEASTPQQIRRLRAGRLDLAIIAVGDQLPDYDLLGVAYEELPVGPLLVAVPTQHRLHGRVRVPVQELADEVWICGRSPRGDPEFGPWPGLAAPVVGPEIADWTTRLGFVAAGLGITTIPSLAAGALPRGVGAVLVDDPGWRGRRLLLAWIGELTPTSAVVRDALHAEAAALVTEGARGAGVHEVAPVPIDDAP